MADSRLLELFPTARKSGAGWMARCPVHEDSTASLSITQKNDGTWLLKCQAGCDTPAIVASVGLTMADLFPAKPKADRREIAAVYDYTDEHGTPLFQKVRYTPKGFAQRRPDPNAPGQWIWKLDPSTRRVLFGLPELKGKPVAYAPEGERDVLSLRKIGLTATTNPEGANNWLPEYTAQLKDAGVENVVVLPDNDEPGRAHAEQVAASCHDAGLQVKVLPLPGLPPKGDVSDWLAAGHTRDELVAMVKAAPLYTMTSAPVPATTDTLTLTSIGDLLNEPEEHIDWCVEGIIPTGGTALVAAKPKVGKSTLARHLALIKARGGEFLGRSCPPGPVWYLALEGRRRDHRNHFRQMGARPSDDLRIFVGQAPLNVIQQVQALAERERPDLIVIDTMQRFLRAEDTDNYAEMTRLFDEVLAIAQRSGSALLLLHHNVKAERASLDQVLGSTAITGSVDTIILLNRTDKFRTIATVQRTGDDMEETVLTLDPHTGSVTLGASRQQADVDVLAGAIVNALAKADGPRTEAELEELVEGRTGLKRKALRDLVAREQVSRLGRGGKSDPYRYTVEGSCSLVPLKRGEQENTIQSSEEISKQLPLDSCSRVPTQGQPREHEPQGDNADVFDY